MATIRKFLDGKGFDWLLGSVYIQIVRGRIDGEPESVRPGWDMEIIAVYRAVARDRILDYEFSDDYGGPECPRFIAYDPGAVYFPAQYDGATWCEKVLYPPERYLEGTALTPYPGG